MSDKKAEKEVKKKNIKAETVKKAPKKVAEETPEVKPVEKPAEVEPVVTARPEKKRGGAGIVIAILMTIIVFMGAFIVLTTLGILKLNIPGLSPATTTETSKAEDKTESSKTETKTDTKTDTKTETKPQLVDNPNQRVKVNNATLFEVGNLEFYLPKKFEAASNNGKNGVYTFNLINDDGWATVTVKMETTTKSPAEYIKSFSDSLKVTNSAYKMNGTTWTEAENPSMLAYATTYGDQVYLIVLTIKIDSEATSDAASMIAKTLYFKKLYQN